MRLPGLYIHIPFCARKCGYCDFVSYAGKEEKVQSYFEALRQELNWYMHHACFSEYQLYSLYVGGGTPSLVTDQLAAFLEEYRTILLPDCLHEATVEVNPGTVTFSQFQQLCQAGVNRVSIGVQSFHDKDLKLLGRIHTGEEAVACIEAARDAGFQNVSIDLMFGIPNSEFMTWESTLMQAISLKPEHLSLYNLSIEEGTPFWKQQQHGEFLLSDDDLQLTMYELGIAASSEAGYEHYEISNFALPGYRSRHNQIYWRNEEYLGLGAGAHSYLNGRRYWNDSGLEHYLARSHSFFEEPVIDSVEGLSKGEHPLPPTVKGEEHLDLGGTIGETVMMNLRLIEGIHLSGFQQRFGVALEILYADRIEKLREFELIEIRDDHLRLTSKGIRLSNEVFQEFVKT